MEQSQINGNALPINAPQFFSSHAMRHCLGCQFMSDFKDEDSLFLLLVSHQALNFLFEISFGDICGRQVFEQLIYLIKKHYFFCQFGLGIAQVDFFFFKKNFPGLSTFLAYQNVKRMLNRHMTTTCCQAYHNVGALDGYFFPQHFLFKHFTVLELHLYIFLC